MIFMTMELSDHNPNSVAVTWRCRKISKIPIMRLQTARLFLFALWIHSLWLFRELSQMYGETRIRSIKRTICVHLRGESLFAELSQCSVWNWIQHNRVPLLLNYVRSFNSIWQTTLNSSADMDYACLGQSPKIVKLKVYCSNFPRQHIS